MPGDRPSATRGLYLQGSACCSEARVLFKCFPFGECGNPATLVVWRFQGGIILATLSGITFIAGILTIILMYMQPEFGYNWECVIPCFVFSFVFMFLPLIGEGLSVGLECMRDGLLDFILD